MNLAQRTSRPPRGFGPKKQLIKVVLDSVEAFLKHTLPCPLVCRARIDR
jgi:hypothetical protein